MQYEAGLDGWVSSEKSGIMKMAGGRAREAYGGQRTARRTRANKENQERAAGGGAALTRERAAVAQTPSGK